MFIKASKHHREMSRRVWNDGLQHCIHLVLKTSLMLSREIIKACHEVENYVIYFTEECMSIFLLLQFFLMGRLWMFLLSKFKFALRFKKCRLNLPAMMNDWQLGNFLKLLLIKVPACCRWSIFRQSNFIFLEHTFVQKKNSPSTFDKFLFIYFCIGGGSVM